jgi:hypothetical protein
LKCGLITRAHAGVIGGKITGDANDRKATLHPDEMEVLLDNPILQMEVVSKVSYPEISDNWGYVKAYALF